MEKLQYILLAFIPLLFSLSFHEAAHAWMANRLGDPTARMMGRMTLNPIPHIDPIGTVILPLAFFFMGGSIFGWAKPVPVNERNLRHGLRDGLLVAASGPLSNLFLACAFTFVLYLLNRALGSSAPYAAASFNFLVPITMMVTIGIQLNVLLAVFNFLPLPPLDGSRVAVGLFPQLAAPFAHVERYGFLLLLLLFYSGIVGVLVYRPTELIVSFLFRLAA
ncbi:MAG: site-2 protease family protein [Pseudomonadota bacterium]